MKKEESMKRTVLVSCVAALALNAQVFELGQVEITATGKGGKLSDSNVVVIDSERLQKDEVKRLSEVAYRTPGLYVDKKGPRAEQNFYVRGFDARRTPLFVDGIPVYIPYDGNVDFGRFTTFDLAKIDISKGSSSVLYGVNTMGGAINLVSQKPTKPFEGSIGYGIERGKSNKTAGNALDFSVGSRQKLFYVQASGSFLEDQGQQLSGDFKKDVMGNEDGNRRENSVQRDKKLSLKAGFTPNESDEYALVYLNQKGEKEQPYYTGRYPKDRIANRVWDWPTWDKESLYFLSHTDFKSFYLKSKLFHDAFDNDLIAHKDKKRSAVQFVSHYRDRSYGLGLEVGGDLSEANTLKVALGYKFDQHKEHDDGEPEQVMEDKTYNFGVENTHRFSDATKLIVGASYDTRDAVKAQSWAEIGAKKKMGMVDFDVAKKHAFNYQATVKHSFSGSDELSVSYARKSYFPSMKERYSTRFGRYIPNPALDPEVANHYEIGYKNNLSDSLRIESALFYSKVKDAINDKRVTVKGEKLLQAHNIDSSDYKGLELAAAYFPMEGLELGGNYTYLKASGKNDGKSATIYDLPKHKAAFYVDYMIRPNVGIYLSQELLSSRYSNAFEETKLGGFGLTHVKVSYQPLSSLNLEAGVRNLFDRNYEYREGYPEEGRVFFANARYKF